MTILFADESWPRERPIEQLVFDLQFGGDGIADPIRVSIEDDVERLFRLWLAPFVGYSPQPADGFSDDIEMFRNASNLLIRLIPSPNSMLFADRIVVIS